MVLSLLLGEGGQSFMMLEAGEYNAIFHCLSLDNLNLFINSSTIEVRGYLNLFHVCVFSQFDKRQLSGSAITPLCLS